MRKIRLAEKIKRSWLLLAPAMLFLPLFFFPSAETAAADVSQIAPEYVAAVQHDSTEESAREYFTTFGEALLHWTDNSALLLNADCETEETIAASGENMTINLYSHTLSLKEGASGPVISVSGQLTVIGDAPEGKITGGNASQGGGIYVGARGRLSLDGVTVTGNRAGEGGGVYCEGELDLLGETVVEGNSRSEGEDCNIFLTRRNVIAAESFNGRAGVTVVSIDEPFARGTGDFFSDDPKYSVKDEEGDFRLVIAPLAEIEATYTETEKVFPTTFLDSLKERVRVTGTNVNGVPYAGQISFVLSGTLKVGSGEVTVTATGEGGETAKTTIRLTVKKPEIVSVQVVAPEYPPKVYFDSSVYALTGEGGYQFRGLYDDGNERVICATSAETAQKSGEEYITEYYTLSGDLSAHEEGKAEITVTVGKVVQTFLAEVSKYVVAVSPEDVVEISVPEGGTCDVGQFVPTLPRGIEVEAQLDASPLDVSLLKPGFYTVELRFVVSDTENYEEISAVLTASLTVLRGEITGKVDGMAYGLTREGGLPPDWRLNVKNVTDSVTAKFEGSLEAQRVFEVTLQREGIVVEEPGKLALRLPIAEELQEEEIRLFLLRPDGTTEEVNATRDGAFLVFSADQLSHAQYVLAVETASQIYLILSIVFGVMCALGAAALLCYLVFKRKMPL